MLSRFRSLRPHFDRSALRRGLLVSLMSIALLSSTACSSMGGANCRGTFSCMKKAYIQQAARNHKPSYIR